MKKIEKILMCLLVGLFLAACSGSGELETPKTGVLNPNELHNKDNEFSLGTVNNNVYENKFIGIGVDLGDEWIFYNEEQIQTVNNYTIQMAGEEFEEAMKKATIVYDMLALNINGVNSININLEKGNNDQIANLNIRSYLEQVVPMVKDTYENMGFTNIVESYETLKIEDSEFLSLVVNCEFQTIQYRVVSIPIKCNGYISSVSIFTYANTNLDSLFDKFYIIK